MDLVNRALRFATEAHAGHVRKYTEEPYVNHLIRVAGLVAERTDDAEMVAAAFLHDTLEDTNVTYAELVHGFGNRVANLVLWLTRISKTGVDGNRARRKRLDLMNLAGADAAAHTIKYADLLDNAKDIVEHDPGFAAVFLPEKAELLAVMTRGDAELRARALAVYGEGKEAA
jgi:(p)ppGpp synthase/HD superfamily hydrolase